MLFCFFPIVTLFLIFPRISLYLFIYLFSSFILRLTVSLQEQSSHKNVYIYNHLSPKPSTSIELNAYLRYSIQIICLSVCLSHPRIDSYLSVNLIICVHKHHHIPPFFHSFTRDHAMSVLPITTDCTHDTHRQDVHTCICRQFSASTSVHPFPLFF